MSNLASSFLFALAWLVLLTPIFFIGWFEPDAGSGETAVATMVFATIFRSNGRNILRSSLMSAIRTTIRMISRRVIRVLIPFILRVFLPMARTSTSKNPDLDSKQPLFLSLTISFFALFFSFLGVLWLHLLQAPSILAGLSLGVGAALAGSALLFHYVYLFVFSRYLNVSVDLQVPADGLLLQAYFTGAGSYLPLASDVLVEGDSKNCAVCSFWCISALLGTSLMFDLIGHLWGSPLFVLWGAQILLYTFVVSFPLPPLQGYTLWKGYKLWWVMIFSLIFCSFVLNLPQPFYAIL
ncbi:MAG: hypothetical protein CMK59_08270 [Proteobacteria bacterium]|nr:hypothetical protein [Pseudomonadota bacterium]